MTRETPSLRILAADEDEAALRRTADVLEGLGHQVTSFAVDVARAAERVVAEDPDLSVVVVHRDDEHALDLIDQLSSSASGPVIERAKGILIERHGLADHAAFELLRGHARANNRSVADCARGVLDGHALLPPRP